MMPLTSWPSNAGESRFRMPARGELAARIPSDHVVPRIAQRFQTRHYAVDNRRRVGVGVARGGHAGAVEDRRCRTGALHHGGGGEVVGADQRAVDGRRDLDGERHRRACRCERSNINRNHNDLGLADQRRQNIAKDRHLVQHHEHPRDQGPTSGIPCSASVNGVCLSHQHAEVLGGSVLYRREIGQETEVAGSRIKEKLPASARVFHQCVREAGRCVRGRPTS